MNKKSKVTKNVYSEKSSFYLFPHHPVLRGWNQYYPISCAAFQIYFVYIQAYIYIHPPTTSLFCVATNVGGKGDNWDLRTGLVEELGAQQSRQLVSMLTTPG